MDTMPVAEFARRAGVSLPTAHKMLDQVDNPRTGRGRPRPVTLELAMKVLQTHPPGFTTSEMRILAAVARSPLGLTSIRRVADVAGISPTTASLKLPSLMERGLVTKGTRQTLRAGKASTETVYSLNVRSSEWLAVSHAVLSTPLPQRRVGKATKVPKSFWHLFWNASPAALRVSSDGAYIARRMLNSTSFSAVQWALLHIDADDLRSAVAGRGADARTKAMVQNWIRDRRADDLSG